MSNVAASLRNLRIAATVSAVAHTLGAFAMAFVLSPGLLPGLLTPRMEYVRNNLFAWQCGWWLWIFSAIAFLVFILALKNHYSPIEITEFNKKLLSTALILVSVAVCFDLFFEFQQIFSVPDVITGAHTDRKKFSLLQFGFTVFSGVIANFLYSGATICSVIAIRKYYPKWVNFLGWATCAFGLTASICAVMTSLLSIAWFSIAVNAVLFPLLIFWQAGFALLAKE